ncbi:MAG: hypothetical protein NT007_06985 [Candidatus Kapabacteria bacterium]|nr:hypothetical protein [Candidatus Kapabacteria bacterium]
MITKSFSKPYNEVLSHSYFFQSELNLNQTVFKDTLKLFTKPIFADYINNIKAVGANLASILEQNQPNPFDNTTTINYYVPSHYTGTIEFVIADNQGNSIMDTKTIIYDKPTSVIISGNNYETGIYLYGIRINGKIVKSKKMMIVK